LRLLPLSAYVPAWHLADPFPNSEDRRIERIAKWKGDSRAEEYMALTCKRASRWHHDLLPAGSVEIHDDQDADER
jgi:hypothetical protein